MFDLPRSTEIRKPIHKTVLYEKFPKELGGDKRRRFDEDIGKIIITNEISENSVNVEATKEISSIFIVLVELKSKEYNDKNIILVSQLFGQKLILALHYNDEFQFAVYESHLLKSEWKKEDEISISLNGLDLSNVWNNLIRYVAGIDFSYEKTLAEQIDIEAKKEKLMICIRDLEIKANKEIQSKKKFEIHQQILENKKELEELEKPEKTEELDG